MSTIGTGDQDWVELDVERFDLDREAALRDALTDHYERISASIGGDFEAVIGDDGSARLRLVGSTSSTDHHIRLGADGRLVLTSVPDQQGLL